MNTPSTISPRRSRGFSLIEMLVALTITSTLLTAALAALDASFKSYKHTTDGASTHVVSRITMHRVLTMIRTGSEFAPYPIDPLDNAQNPVTSTYIEFHGYVPPTEPDLTRIIRLERRDSGRQVGGAPLYELWFVQEDYDGESLTGRQERPLIRNLRELTFLLEYDVGPRLRRATVDMTVRPDDTDQATVYTTLQSPTIRFVSSVSPRRLEEVE